MEVGIKGEKKYKLAVIGNEPLTLGMRMSGVTQAYTAITVADAEDKLRELLQKEDIGIIIITSKLASQIKDRRLSEAIESSVMPLIVQVPDLKEEMVQEDNLRKLILRAIGIDIGKTV